jgi:hypothetical protein
MNEVEDRLDRLEKKLDQLLAMMSKGAAARAVTPPHTAGIEVASDSELDSLRGNPEVRFIPRRWSGADCKGKRYSECEPEFLDMLAEALEWFAQREEESGAVDKNGNPKSKWTRLDASRARGWSARRRADRGDLSDEKHEKTSSTSRSVEVVASPTRPAANGKSRSTVKARPEPESDEEIPF